MVPSLGLPTRKKLKAILEVTTNVVVVLFAVVAIGVLVKNYFAPQSAKTSVAFKKGSSWLRLSRDLTTLVPSSRRTDSFISAR
jgi:hypothetical protein